MDNCRQATKLLLFFNFPSLENESKIKKRKKKFLPPNTTPKSQHRIKEWSKLVNFNSSICLTVETWTEKCLHLEVLEVAGIYLIKYIVVSSFSHHYRLRHYRALLIKIWIIFKVTYLQFMSCFINVSLIFYIYIYHI